MHLAPNTDTVPASVNKYLLPRERIVITVHYHPAILIGPIGLVVAGLVAAAVASNTAKLSPDALLIIWFAWLLLLFYLLGRVLRWTEDYFVATAERLILVTGLLTRDVVSIPKAQAASMRFRRSSMGRVLGYGQFIIEAGRHQPIHAINFLPYPEQLYLEVYSMVHPEEE